MKSHLQLFGLLTTTALSLALVATGASAQTVATTPEPSQAPAPVTSDSPATGSQESESADIVVTAQKRAQSINSVPLSITAVSGDALLNQGVTDVAQLTKLTPGLSYVESGNSVPVYSLRGVGFFDTAIGARPTVSVYVDEAPLPFSIMSVGAAFDLERVEVLKGPQGTLFGSNATGGAINYIAAKPTSELRGGATASYARFDTVDVQGFISGPITDGLAARIAVRTVHSGPVQRSYTRDDGLGRQNFTQGRVQLLFDKVENLRVTLNLNGFHDGGETQAGQFRAVVPVRPAGLSTIPDVVNYPIAPENDRAADWNPNQRLRKDNTFYQAALRAEYDLSDAVEITSLTSYSHERVDQVVDIDGTAINNALATVIGRVSSFSHELRLSGDAGPLNWLVGGNYSHDKSRERNSYSFTYTSSNGTFGPGTLLNAVEPFGRQDFESIGLFGNGDLELGRRFVLHGGLRYTRTDLDYAACLLVANANSGQGFTLLYNRLRAASGLAPIATLQVGQCSSLNGLTPGLNEGELNQDNLSWRTGLDFKPSRGVLLYVSLSRGYKGGSIPVTAATSNRSYLPVTQESVLAGEAGIKAELLNRKLVITGAGFYYDYSDKQVLGRVVDNPDILGPLQALVNIPTSRIVGAEAQVTGFVTRGVTLSAAATYLDSKVTGSFPNFDILGRRQEFGGNSFPYTPKWQIVLSADVERPVSDSLKAVGGANFNYRTKTTAGFGGDDLLRIDSYGLLDLRAGLADADDRWRVEVFGRNVTNTYYWTNVAKFYDVVRRLAGQPATYGVQASFRF